MFRYLGFLLIGLSFNSLQAQQLKDLGLGGVLAVGYELEYEMPVVGFGFQFDGNSLTLEVGMSETSFAIGSDFDLPILRLYDYTYLSTGLGFRAIEDDLLTRLNLGLIIGKVRLKVSHGWIFTRPNLDRQEERATMLGLQLFL